METDVLRHAVTVEVREISTRMPSAESFGFRSDQTIFENFGHIGYARALACWLGCWVRTRPREQTWRIIPSEQKRFSLRLARGGTCQPQRYFFKSAIQFSTTLIGGAGAFSVTTGTRKRCPSLLGA